MFGFLLGFSWFFLGVRLSNSISSSVNSLWIEGRIRVENKTESMGGSICNRKHGSQSNLSSAVLQPNFYQKLQRICYAPIFANLSNDLLRSGYYVGKAAAKCIHFYTLQPMKSRELEINCVRSNTLRAAMCPRAIR